MGREALLAALLEHNRSLGVSTAIWGEGAAEAARQAVAAGAASLPRCSTEATATALRLDTPLDLAYAVRCDAPERLHFPVRGGLPGLEASPQTLEVALLKQGVVREWQGHHLLLQEGGVVADGSSAYWPLAGGALAAAGVTAPGEPQRREALAEAFLVCDDLDATNFCHFVCDLLPKIALAGECRRRIPIVIEPPSQPFQRELLARVGERCGHPIVPLEPGLELTVQRLFYLRRAGHTHPLLRCSGLAMGWVRQLVEARPAAAPPDSVLYLGRRSRRRVRGEEALIGALLQHTPRLQVVQGLEGLGVREQAELVGSHRTVLGPHGAGFTHLLFAGAAPQVALELMAEGNGTLSFALISARLGIDHRIHVGGALSTDQGPNYPDLEVEPEAVLALLTAT
ncbi:glycosyltransferase family 61 protein [Synechococcus sp. GreenBA-s]|nr:glycosyltransferase family 61 protein [Synechococcus sp. GreenBA-s]